MAVCHSNVRLKTLQHRVHFLNHGTANNFKEWKSTFVARLPRSQQWHSIVLQYCDPLQKFRFLLWPQPLTSSWGQTERSSWKHDSLFRRATKTYCTMGGNIKKTKWALAICPTRQSSIIKGHPATDYITWKSHFKAYVWLWLCSLNKC